MRQADESDDAWKARERDFAPVKMSYDLEHKKWVSDNRKCLAVIKNMIDPAIAGSVPDYDTATESLERIKSQFTGSTKTYVTQLIK